MEMTDAEALAALTSYLDLAENAVMLIVAVFVRIGAIVFMLPGVGERMVSVRVKLMIAIAFALATWPLLPEATRTAGMALQPTAGALAFAFMAEAICGIVIGFGIRVLIFALQTAGTLASQSLSINQMFGAGVAPDPEPTVATLLTFGGIALALNLGLHVKAVSLMAVSYQILPLGEFPLASDVADWAAARVAEAFGLAVSLALPFLVISFGYNLALGFINRAMPQMMVSFVGLPAITWAGVLLLMIVSSAILNVWHGHMDAALLAPWSDSLR